MLQGKDTPAQRPRRLAERSSRRSGLRAFLFLLVALAAAGGAVVLVRRTLHLQAGPRPIPTQKVVVAAKDLPLGTELRPEQLQVVDWPQQAVPTGTFAAPEALAGRILNEPLRAHEPVLQAQLAGADAGKGLAALLPLQMLAVSVKVDQVVGVAGFIQPGDHVDVIVTMRAKEHSTSPPTSKTILQNVRVLAVGAQVSAPSRGEATPINATVATLMVNAEQAEWLALAATEGKLLLALRSAIDDTLTVTPGVIAERLLEGTQPLAEAPPPRSRPGPKAPAAAPPKHDPEGRVVEILTGDKLETRHFAGEEP